MKEALYMMMDFAEAMANIDLSVAVYSYPGTDPGSRDQCFGAVR